MGEPWTDLTTAFSLRPGRGTVWVAEGAAELASLRGSHEEVVAWPLPQPAARRLTPVLQVDGNFNWADLKPTSQPPEAADR